MIICLFWLNELIDKCKFKYTEALRCGKDICEFDLTELKKVI